MKLHPIYERQLQFFDDEEDMANQLGLDLDDLYDDRPEKSDEDREYDEFMDILKGGRDRH